MLTPGRLSTLAAATAAAALAVGVGVAGAHGSYGHDFGAHGSGISVAGANWLHDRDFGARDDGVVFVQTDNPSGNAIVVYDRHLDGTLRQAGTYPTGGLGAEQAGSVVDHLASQGSLQYDAAAGELFAVNAGSDTVSVFGVNGDHLALRQTVSSAGAFPSSITIHGDLVYVLDALGSGGIQGYRLLYGHLTPLPGSARGLGLDPSATPQYVNTPGQVAFTPDGRELIVTTKANGSDIDVFSVNAQGLPAPSPTVNAEGANVPFAVAFEGDSQVVVGEAGDNAVASFTLAPNGVLQPISSVATGGQATCWLLADGPVLFAGNAGSGTESSVLDLPFGTLKLAATTNTDPGTVDGATSPDGRYLYVQTGGNGILDEFRVGFAGALTPVGNVIVPGAVGGEGIATS